MENKKYPLNVKLLRQLLIAADDIMHFVVAAILLFCAGVILAGTLPDLLSFEVRAVLLVLNNVLLALIIMEMMWPIIRFLKRESFSINPFLYIGIISSIRRILLLEAEHSMFSGLKQQATPWAEQWPLLVELGVNVGIILALAVALRILCGRGSIEPEK